MNKSLPRGAPPPPISRTRSKSVADRGSSSAKNRSGRSSPHLPPRSIQGLFAPDDAPRTSSPATQHMLDTSLDEQDSMFAHAVMQRSSAPSSPDRHVPPEVPPRKGSAGSPASTPRLPPRPSLAPSPTISEFGQLPTPKGKSGPGSVEYATYTPGVAKRGGGEGIGTMTPPALPPRSATVGLAERGRLEASPYQARQKSPLKPPKPEIPKKPASSRPAPPPRPYEGSAGGFRFGSNDPPPRQRTLSAATKNQTGGVHRKTGSNVFTSISLSDDASSELKRSLESDIHADHPPPPARSRLPSNPTPRNTTASGGVVSSLIGTAAALPIFKSGSPFTTSGRSLADGAPSKQGYYTGGGAISRSGSAQSGDSGLTFRPGEGEGWGQTRAVELADTPKTKVGLGEVEDGARRRYEALFEAALSRQRRRRGKGQSKEKGEGVKGLRGWFESEKSPAAHSSPLPEGEVLSPRTVKKIWSRSKLPPSVLAQVWDQAVAFQASSDGGLGKEAFIRGMARIDSELERRKKRRERKTARSVKKEGLGVGRRVPPPPPT